MIVVLKKRYWYNKKWLKKGTELDVDRAFGKKLLKEGYAKEKEIINLKLIQNGNNRNS